MDSTASSSEIAGSPKGAQFRLEVDVARRSNNDCCESGIVLHLSDGRKLHFSASTLDELAKELDLIAINMSKADRIS